MTKFNVYCDESCHLEHDESRFMGLGAVWAPQDKIQEINNRIKEIKIRHKINVVQELKWTKVQPSKLLPFEDLVNYFFDNDELRFRAVIVDKNKLNHGKYEQTHDEFYYKMYYQLIIHLLQPNSNYNFYIDIKDTKHKEKISKLQNITNRKQASSFVYELPQKTVAHNFQVIRSNEVQIMQLTDILLGAIVCHCRDIEVNNAKSTIINLIKKKSGYSLTETTMPSEPKLNILHFPLGDK